MSIVVGFAFSDKGLKSQDIQFRIEKLYTFFDNVLWLLFGLGIFTTHLTYQCLKCFTTWKIPLTE